MLQIKNLTITHRKDLRVLLEDFSFVLNRGDKAVIVGEEGNGKSTLLRWIYDPEAVDGYAECDGERIITGERLGYLPQELCEEDKHRSLYEFFSEAQFFFEKTPKELAALAAQFLVDSDIFYSEKLMGCLSGGEKIKVQLMRLLIDDFSVLLLDEPSNDLDIDTLELLEQIINEEDRTVMFISHDETLIENTATTVIHIEQIVRKTKSRYTVARMAYTEYITGRLHRFEKQEQLALAQRREKRERDERYRHMLQRVEHDLAGVSRQDPSIGRLLKKKMHTVKSIGRRFEREDENMIDMPEQEEAIFFRLGGPESAMPAGKTVLEFSLDSLKTPDGSRELSRNIFLRVRGPERLCIIGTNGTGKTTLLHIIAEQLLERTDIRAMYMPQNYEELLDLDATPVDYLDGSGDREERTRIKTYLGSLKYTADEMSHPIRELSGGQKAKVLLLKMSMSGANVLLLDEPTRNFSPLSGPVIRQMLAEFPGTIISISHDRKFIGEVCDRIYRLSADGLEEIWEDKNE